MVQCSDACSEARDRLAEASHRVPRLARVSRLDRPSSPTRSRTLRLVADGEAPAGRVPAAPIDHTVLAGLAHELRTPLSTMQIMVEMLTDDPAFITSELQPLLRSMSRAVTWMNALVDDIATLSAVQGGTLELHPVTEPVTSWITPALAIAQPILARKGQTVRIVCPTPAPLATGDAVRLGQALLNLLTNAGRYGPVDDVIEFQVAVESGHVRLCVTDHGPGVQPDEQGRIFDAHVRGRQARSGAVRGQGLGLYIVREVIQRHGGRVGVTSTPGCGASFWFSLPEATTAVSYGFDEEQRCEDSVGG